MKSTKRLPEDLHAAYNWTDAAGEIDLLRGLTGDELSAYADESAANAQQHDQNDVAASDIVALAAWLKQGMEMNEMEMKEMVSAPRFLRTDFDGSSEVLTLVRVTSGPWLGATLVQVTTGPDMGDDFVGLYELDGEQVDPHGAGAEWEALTQAPQHVVDTIESDWETGSRIVTRIGSTGAVA